MNSEDFHIYKGCSAYNENSLANYKPLQEFYGTIATLNTRQQ